MDGVCGRRYLAICCSEQTHWALRESQTVVDFSAHNRKAGHPFLFRARIPLWNEFPYETSFLDSSREASNEEVTSVATSPKAKKRLFSQFQCKVFLLLPKAQTGGQSQLDKIRKSKFEFLENKNLGGLTDVYT